MRQGYRRMVNRERAAILIQTCEYMSRVWVCMRLYVQVHRPHNPELLQAVRGCTTVLLCSTNMHYAKTCVVSGNHWLPAVDLSARREEYGDVCRSELVWFSGFSDGKETNGY